MDTLAELLPGGNAPRVIGREGTARDRALLEKYGTISECGYQDDFQFIRTVARDLLAGAVNWRGPDTMYNLGAPVNAPAAAAYALALDLNVYLINDGLAGNAILAEAAVAKILAGLAGIDPAKAHGVFTFGGTGTILYGMKMGTRRLAPESDRTGLPVGISIAITEDAHFSHPTAADWLGVGTNNLILASPGDDRRTNVDDLEVKLRAVLASGGHLAAIIANGGTTYDHTVDDIERIALLRDDLVREYELEYVPHLHVDSVIGWAWLTFQGYDFETNPMQISPDVLERIRTQHERIAAVQYADSWGVDFHKGVGGCPVDCSFVMARDRRDLARLARNRSPLGQMHQLAAEFSAHSPCDYTLETSRAGGKALAALTSLQGLGLNGYRSVLAGLLESTARLRNCVSRRRDMTVLNSYALGYQTMVRLYPPEHVDDRRRTEELRGGSDEIRQFVEAGNKYMKAFFRWDNETRMEKNGGGMMYSFSSKFVRAASLADISGLKLYLTSPRTTPDHAEAAIKLLGERKQTFDATLWPSPRHR
ncbi:MAG: pyridoxal-dependent decarboxylase [Gemmatimonadota bacterium]|nr:pyridoxal-dependent decarboxylase [Gemmatimonadota bacterium]